NIGASKVYDKLGGARFVAWLKRMHFGDAPSFELPGAEAGVVSAKARDGGFDGAVVAIGEGLTASPLEIAAAYAAIANRGVYVRPTLLKRVASSSGRGERVMKPETATAIVAMLERAVNDERATGAAARVQSMRVAGKTGTAEWLTSANEETH